MRLGLLTAPFPDDAAHGGRRLGGRRTASRASRSPAGRARPGRPGATPARATSTSRTCRPARRARSSTRSPRRAWRSPGLGYYPNPLHPDPAHRAEVIGHLRHVITAAEKMGVPLVNTFMGADGAKNQDDNWEEALRVWPDIVAVRRGPRAQDHHRELPDAVQLRRVAGRPQPRDDAADLAPDPRAVGRHDRAQLRPVAPDPPDDRHPALHPRVRAAHPPRPGQGPDDRPRRPLRARHLLDGDGLADPAPARARRRRLGLRCSRRCGGRATTAT